MALTAATNTLSLRMQQSLTANTAVQNQKTASLSSGQAVNTAKDDPSNLQISERYTSQIDCTVRGNKNSDEGMAVAVLAEQSLGEITELLQRIRVLSIEAANGTYASVDRQAIQQEALQLSNEITRIACKTTYGGAQLLRGAGHGIINDQGNLELQVGANANNTMQVKLDASFALSDLNDTVGGLGIGYDAQQKCFDLTTQDKAQAVLAGIDDFITYVDGRRAEAGSVAQRLESTIRNQSNVHENESGARSRMRDADFAKETAELTAARISTDISAQMLLQANTQPNFVLSLLR